MIYILFYIYVYVNKKLKEKKRSRHKSIKEQTLKRVAIGLTADISIAIIEARGQNNVIFILLKENNCQPKILYITKISFMNNNKIKTSSCKLKLKCFIYSIFSKKGNPKQEEGKRITDK